MIFYHFTTLMLPQGSAKGGGIVNVFRMFLFVLLVLSESQFKMKYPFYYARLSTIKNVQSGLDEIGSFGLSSQYYVLNN